MIKTFAGFLKGNVSITPVRAVALYVEKRTDGKGDVKRRIEADHAKGVITDGRKETLLSYLEACWEVYLKTGKQVDERDSRDWEDLGNGARRKRTFKNSDGGAQ